MNITAQTQALKIKLWGIRGSMPVSPSPNVWASDFKKLFYQFFTQGYTQLREVDIFLGQQKITHVGGYGAATTCVEVQTTNGQLIINAGSGIKNLGDKMMAGPCGKGQGHAHIFLGQFHWDHIIGLPFFTPIFIEGNEIHFYAAQMDLEKTIRTIFKKPYFPVPFEALPTKIFFHTLKAHEPFHIEDMQLIPCSSEDNKQCWGLRVEAAGKTYSHYSEPDSCRFTNQQLSPNLALYKNTDLFYYDTRFDQTNSAVQLGIDIAMQENVKRIVFANHDIESNTNYIQKLETEIQKYYIWKLENAHSKQLSIHPVQWSFAFEQQVFEL